MPEPTEPSPVRPSLIEQEVSALTSLEALSTERAQSEAETEKAFRVRREEEARAFETEKARVTNLARTDTLDLKAKYQTAKDLAVEKRAKDTAGIEAEYAEAKRKVASATNSARGKAKKVLEDTRWQALAMFEAGKDAAIKNFKDNEARLAAAGEQLDVLKAYAAPVLARTARFAPTQAPTDTVPVPEISEQPLDDLDALNAEAETLLAPLDRLVLPKLLAPAAFPWLFLILGGALGFLAATRFGLYAGIAVGVVVAVAAGVGAWVALAKVARGQVAKHRPALVGVIQKAEALVESSKGWTKARFEQEKNDVEAKRAGDVKAADVVFQKAVAVAEAVRGRESKAIEETFPARLQAVAQTSDAAVKQADDYYPRKIGGVQERFQAESARIGAAYEQATEATRTLQEKAWATLEARWRDGLAAVGATADGVNEVARRQFLDWHDPALDVRNWSPPPAVPQGLQLGRFVIDQAEIPSGIPIDPRLKAYGPTRLDLPALLPFPRVSSVMIQTTDAGKGESVKLLQSLMLRFATSVPAGKVRFTIVDPVGLGENFAAFMHLADYSELLVNSRIWTETQHIEQRLGDLSAHMENVIQKYLRNEFESIEDYNAFAGEVAEPFRVLVVANFPANFSETAARRLVSIMGSGARCGVYVLMSVDTKQQLPTGIALKDLEPHSIQLRWRDGKIQWRDKAFGRFPLTLDAPPDPERFTALMHRVGDLARNANRVEVPFEFIAPTPDQYWTGDSRSGVDVPLGRAGATKLQHLRLGKGTSQHVLTAGKTGSGKSTLLHALITNAALRYSPDEIEMYLIDFKKGVEFKVYAALELPHARVIAVESEREFGLSVLQRLDAELKSRGDQFRDLGVQDLRGYREATGGTPPLPRIMLIVDEFQEFFVEDDKIAQEVSLLLDRLVRQGRAFGIHVILGSQTLSGAYSLARSTLGQMAVRIALQCSESDAHLILSEENSAARLLTRPGEAIYNDANGLVEGNNFFQVVWLSDERREDYLRQISDLAKARNRPPSAQIVFEGNLPAIPTKNHLLAGLMQPPGWPEAPKADTAWLGEAIAIKDPTAAVFRPQSGSNLLIIGQNDAMALGIASMLLISLAAQHDPNGVKFFLMDGTPADSPLAGTLGSLQSALPHTLHETTPRDVAATLTELSNEIERRQRTGDSADAPVLYLVIFDVQRWRDLRKAEDDYSFSSSYGQEKATPPAKLFANILRDGPPLGVHTVVWCDSLNNLNRTFERQALREFEMRVLFQMSANDSSTLIDAPSAGRLGPNRALYFSEEEGRLEKFRPYAVPTDEWLAVVRAALLNRPWTPREPVVAAVEGAPETSEL